SDHRAHAYANLEKPASPRPSHEFSRAATFARVRRATARANGERVAPTKRDRARRRSSHRGRLTPPKGSSKACRARRGAGHSRERRRPDRNPPCEARGVAGGGATVSERLPANGPRARPARALREQ